MKNCYICAVIAFFLIAQPAIALEFHGYFRSGIGANNNGGDQQCFKLPGAGSKFRLGNECEAYGTLKISEAIKIENSPSKFKVFTTFAFESEAEKTGNNTIQPCVM